MNSVVALFQENFHIHMKCVTFYALFLHSDKKYDGIGEEFQSFKSCSRTFNQFFLPQATKNAPHLLFRYLSRCSVFRVFQVIFEERRVCQWGR